MKTTPDTKTVRALLELRKNNMLIVNPEYQRGEVWTQPQQKRLIDSVLRGYPIPLIYLHYIKREVAGFQQHGFEVIDGQQRINALYLYTEGQFKLFDPVADEADARFPSFIKDCPCEWGGKKFDVLSPELQKQLLETALSVVLIEPDVPNEARDLFIRLQAGMPLTPQEKRDAWPGNFTEFILKVAGKPEIPKYPGDEFFTKVMGAKAGKRGEMRQLAAQLVMLFLARRETGTVCNTARDDIDTFYYKHLNFDHGSPDARRFVEILKMLTQLLGDGKRSKVIGHEAMHLVMLVDSLWDEYTRSWTGRFATAFDFFRVALAKDKLTKDDVQPGEFWLQYGVHTRVASDRGSTIQRRHEFFSQKMLALLRPELKDPIRIFGPIERELIYYRDKKTCQVCSAEVRWDEHEIHHVDGHAGGGATVIENGALVHKHCHPKGKAAEEFAVKHKAKMASTASKPSS
jgi:hypothetical protein